VGDDFTFVVEKDLFENAKPITVDIGFTGFVVESNLPMMGGGCSPGSCGPSAGGSCAC
jgi:hypothetical protein